MVPLVHYLSIYVVTRARRELVEHNDMIWQHAIVRDFGVTENVPMMH